MWECSCKEELGFTQSFGSRSHWPCLVSNGAPIVLEGGPTGDMYPGPTKPLKTLMTAPLEFALTEYVSCMLHAAPVQVGVPVVSRLSHDSW